MKLKFGIWEGMFSITYQMWSSGLGYQMWSSRLGYEWYMAVCGCGSNRSFSN